MELFAEGKTDAFLGFPPEPQELRARKIGRVILNTRHATGRGRSTSAACCYGNRALVRDHPVATKRFLRAILKAADFCAAEPESAARRLVDGGFTPTLRLRAPDAHGSCPTTAGASTTRRTRCASTRCACTRPA